MSADTLNILARYIAARNWAEGGREAVILDRLKSAASRLQQLFEEWKIDLGSQERMLCDCLGFHARSEMRASYLSPLLPQRPPELRQFLASRPVLLFRPQRNQAIVATSDPRIASQRDELSLVVGVPVKLVYFTTAELEAGRRLLAGALSEVPVEQAPDEELPKEQYTEESGPVVQLVDLIIQEAMRRKASDIHVEPFEKNGFVRYRIDGVLVVGRDYASELHPAIVSRIKLIAGMDIAERRIPQDGRIRYTAGGMDFDIRVATIPSYHGEGVVMRLLSRGAVKAELEAGGFRPQVLQRFRDAFSSTQGIILVTGPTGSGKTTTLYGMLNELNQTDTKIFTIEDPVEYELEGVVQVPVNPKTGMTFAAGLRSFLRCDPDIIMVGEIRDHETAEIAVKASLTGHLVLATLHTNSAPATLARLLDMGVEPYNLSATIQGVLAQRLVRKLCGKCARQIQAPASVKELFARNKVALTGPLLEEAGCEACGMTGYSGRMGVHEFMSMTEPLRAAVNRTAPESELRAIAQSEGMHSLLQDGLLKAAQQQTSVREVLRVMGGVLGGAE